MFLIAFCCLNSHSCLYFPPFISIYHGNQISKSFQYLSLLVEEIEFIPLPSMINSVRRVFIYSFQGEKLKKIVFFYCSTSSWKARELRSLGVNCCYQGDHPFWFIQGWTISRDTELSVLNCPICCQLLFDKDGGYMLVSMWAPGYYAFASI